MPSLDKILIFPMAAKYIYIYSGSIRPVPTRYQDVGFSNGETSSHRKVRTSMAIINSSADLVLYLISELRYISHARLGMPGERKCNKPQLKLALKTLRLKRWFI